MSEWTDTATVKKQKFIHASPEKAFAVLEDFRNFPKYAPSVSNLTPVGDSYQLTYTVKLAGIADIPFHVTVRVSDAQKPKTITYTSEGMLKATLRWTLQPEGDGTVVSIDMRYQMSTSTLRDKGGSLGKLVGDVLDSLTGLVSNVLAANDANAEAGLDNLKKLIES